MMFDPDELPLDEMEESPLKTNKSGRISFGACEKTIRRFRKIDLVFVAFQKTLDGFLAGTS